MWMEQYVPGCHFNKPVRPDLPSYYSFNPTSLSVLKSEETSQTVQITFTGNPYILYMLLSENYKSYYTSWKDTLNYIYFELTIKEFDPCDFTGEVPYSGVQDKPFTDKKSAMTYYLGCVFELIKPYATNMNITFDMDNPKLELNGFKRLTSLHLDFKNTPTSFCISGLMNSPKSRDIDTG